MKDSIVEIKNKENSKIDYVILEKLIPKLPSSLVGLIFKTVPSNEQIEVS